MRPLFQSLTFIILLLTFLSACTDEHAPANRPPTLTLDPAQDITRTSATLSGSVSIPQGSRVDVCRFYYGPTTAELTRVDVSLTGERVSAGLKDLVPGTTYLYYMEAGTSSSLVSTPTLTFQTLPNVKPTLHPAVIAGQGPTSVMLQCKLADDGGSPVTRQGFLYAESGTATSLETAVSAEWEDSLMQVRILGLKEHTRYTLRAFAENELGCAYSEPLEFETDQAFHLYTPGTLPLLVEEDIYAYEDIALAGPLNGTDIKLLRMMAGMDDQEHPTPGRLARLDLTDASIVEGGEPYHFSRYTETDVVGYAMFRGCPYLSTLRLPYGVKRVESDAFTDCTALKRLVLAEEVEEIVPSAGCTALQDIEVSTSNAHYSSLQGILYNKDGTKLLWYPLGKNEDELVLSPSLLALGEYALQECKAKRVVLPDMLKEVGRGAFFRASLEEIRIPSQVASLYSGTFQECRSLHTVILGSGIKLVSAYSFADCPSLTTLRLECSLPPTCDETAFDPEAFTQCSLIVPKGSLEIYRNHPLWGRFQHISEATD